MLKKQNIFSRFFGVIISGKTYLNLIYLFLAFPLGLIYFLFLVIGLSFGFATLIVLIGVALLAIVVAGWWGFANLERQMANHLLGESIPPLSSTEASGKGLGESILAHFSNPLTWKSLLYLFLKFPAGILTFIILVILFSITGFFSTAIVTFNFFNLSVDLSRDLSWEINTFGKALISLPIGILFGFTSLHLCNLLARLSGRFAHIMLTVTNQADQQITPIATSEPSLAPIAPITTISEDTHASETEAPLSKAMVDDIVNPSWMGDEKSVEIPNNLEASGYWQKEEEESEDEKDV